MSKLADLFNLRKKAFPLETTIRKAEKRDVAVIAKWIQEDDFQFMLSATKAASLKETKNKLLKQISLNRIAYPARQTLIVESKNTPLGFITLARIDWRNKTCALESYFDKKYRETPFPVTSGVKVFSYVFQELEMRKIYSFVQGFNSGSLKIHENYGAKPEAILKDYILKNGKYYDMYVFATYRDSKGLKDMPTVLQNQVLYEFFPELTSVKQLTGLLIALQYLPEEYAAEKKPSAKIIKEAIKKYQKDHNLEQSGEFSKEMLGSVLDEIYPLLRNKQL
jgi:RimJ/RimL family protein N-acetyltransferase